MVCAFAGINFLERDADRIIVVPDMKLSPNVGSDRSWVWNAGADVSEGEPEPCTLAIRFANSESKHLPVQSEGRLLTHIQTPTSSKKPSSRLNRRTKLSSSRTHRLPN
jgi:hypothetical protein